MQDPIDRWESRGETGDGVAVGDVNRQKGEPGGRLQTRQPCLLKRGIVIVVKAIDANHLLAAGKQGVGGMHADKAGRAGHENSHRLRSVPMKAPSYA